ncbi:hypothetical protein BDP27DRAFT_1488740 [Rhodocollybia butyracea]|uniref:Uncharacterized protein n=1 Tax=Rhodocollybia butyracea TaxID=206335 RepID=A0A9P5U0G4_9AGAR|nr:hypothetical protein BDP27DRAFT_1488740 [Rhodocollybia butyracea]
MHSLLSLSSNIFRHHPSSAIDVVGIEFASGEISVYDVRMDERLMRMFMEGGGVRPLGFRSGVLDSPTAVPRLLKFRSGHHALYTSLGMGNNFLPFQGS